MLDSDLPHFTWKVLSELPVEDVAIQFPRDPKDSSKFCVVQVTTKDGFQWIGNFTGIDNRYLSGVFPWPDPDRLCVVAGGNAYVVTVDNPDLYDELPVIPIIDMYNALEQGIILFATFSEISAFAKTGPVWKTKNLAKDGIEIAEVKNGIIYGITKSHNGDSEFRIDLRTGQQYK